MNKKILSILLLLFNLNTFSQYKSIVVCNEDDEGLPFVSIKLLKENLYSSSDISGKFVIDCSLDDTLEIKSIGYKSVKYKIEKIKNFKNDTIYLERKYVDLKEIWIIPNQKRIEYKLGVWNNKIAKSTVKGGHGEVASFYNIKSTHGFILKEVRFFVNDFYNSKIIIASLHVNKAIIHNKKLIPSETNLLYKVYSIEINEKNKWYSIVLDSSSFNLINCDSIFVKIQFLNLDYGKNQGWVKLGIDNRKKTTYTLGNSKVIMIGGTAWWTNDWYYKFPYNFKTGIKISY